MDFTISQEQQMLQDLVRKFVAECLIPLEGELANREASTGSGYLTDSEKKRCDDRARELGLFGLDAPESVGGADLSNLALTAVNEELGYTAVYYELPPNSGNLRILMEEASDAQKEKYIPPLVSGEWSTAIMVSEPGAGGDPSAMKTTAKPNAEGWLLKGRKIWISNAADADFYFVFAVTGRNQKNKPEVTAFIVDRDTPGITVEREVPMLAGWKTYEVAIDNCQLKADAVLGEVGQGWRPLRFQCAWNPGALKSQAGL